MRRILIIVGILIVLCVVGVVAVFVIGGGAILNATKPLGDTSNDFMTAIKNNDYAKAYGMVIAEQQPSFGGSADGMKQLFETQGWAEPANWNFTSFNINNNDGVVSGDVTLKDNSKKSVNINLRKSGDQWKILGFGVK